MGLSHACKNNWILVMISCASMTYNIMRVYEREVLSQVVEYVIACDCSTKKRGIRVIIFSFKIVAVKVLTQSNGNSTIGFPIAQTHCERFMELCTVYRSSYVLYFVAGDLEN